jgi:hypothetical protein
VRQLPLRALGRHADADTDPHSHTHTDAHTDARFEPAAATDRHSDAFTGTVGLLPVCFADGTLPGFRDAGAV